MIEGVWTKNFKETKKQLARFIRETVTGDVKVGEEHDLSGDYLTINKTMCGKQYSVWFGDVNETIGGSVTVLEDGVFQPEGDGIETYVLSECPALNVVAYAIVQAFLTWQDTLIKV